MNRTPEPAGAGRIRGIAVATVPSLLLWWALFEGVRALVAGA